VQLVVCVCVWGGGVDEVNFFIHTSNLLIYIYIYIYVCVCVCVCVCAVTPTRISGVVHTKTGR
jgi:hypothetical protein